MQTQKISIPNFHSLCFFTDGIFSFKNLDRTTKEWEIEEIVNFLLLDVRLTNNEMFFETKCEQLKKEFKQYLTDDLAVIYLTLDEKK